MSGKISVLCLQYQVIVLQSHKVDVCGRPTWSHILEKAAYSDYHHANPHTEEVGNDLSAIIIDFANHLFSGIW